VTITSSSTSSSLALAGHLAFFTPGTLFYVFQTANELQVCKEAADGDAMLLPNKNMGRRRAEKAATAMLHIMRLSITTNDTASPRSVFSIQVLDDSTGITDAKVVNVQYSMCRLSSKCCCGTSRIL
jgi:hypothetical protein